VTAAGYEYFDVEADVGIRAWGSTLAEAFGQAALAAFALTVNPTDVQTIEHREVRAQADSREELLVNWINECLYVHEIEGFVVARVDVDTCDGRMVHGTLAGEEFDPRRHRPGTIVKAATFHQTAVTETASRVDIRLVVDV
jgi:SHS2 domain-containing protein